MEEIKSVEGGTKANVMDEVLLASSNTAGRKNGITLQQIQACENILTGTMTQMEAMTKAGYRVHDKIEASTTWRRILKYTYVKEYYEKRRRGIVIAMQDITLAKREDIIKTYNEILANAKAKTGEVGWQKLAKETNDSLAKVAQLFTDQPTQQVVVQLKELQNLTPEELLKISKTPIRTQYKVEEAKPS
jgi:hypothetical protein